jgi:hypothetical protein
MQRTTMPVWCHEGKCITPNGNFLDDCIDCDIVEQIEHELLKEELPKDAYINKEE